MPCNHSVSAIDQDGVVKAKLPDAGCNLGHLRIRVRAGIAGVRDELLQWTVIDVQLGSHGGSGHKKTRSSNAWRVQDSQRVEGGA